MNMENFIERKRKPLVQIWKDGVIVKVLHCDAEEFNMLLMEKSFISELRPFVAKFGYIDTVIEEITCYSDERRQPCTEK